MEILKSLFILWCTIGLINGAKVKEYECTVRHNTTFSPFEEKFTACVLRFVNYISGKGLKFSNSTNDIAYNRIKLAFTESNIETIPNIIFDTFTNMEILVMNQVGLRNIFPSSFHQASNLRVFHAYENKITSLNAYSFIEAIKLEYLDLSKNKIQSIHVEAFKGLSKLKELSLIGNRISILDEQTFEPLKALTWIWLDRNEIKIISLSLFVTNQNLKGMNLGGNKISAFSTILLDKLPQLRFLFLTGNNCTSQSFVNTVVAYNANIKKELALCYKEYRSIEPNEEEKYQLKNVLRDAEKAKLQCETDKTALLKTLETTRQQLAVLKESKKIEK